MQYESDAKVEKKTGEIKGTKAISKMPDHVFVDPVLSNVRELGTSVSLDDREK